MMNNTTKEIINLSNNGFIQSNWTPKEGDFIFDGFKIRNLAVNNQFKGNTANSIDVFVAPDIDSSYVWKHDFKTVQFRTLNYSLMTVVDPLWLPIGFDLDEGEYQIDILLMKRLNLNGDAEMESLMSKWRAANIWTSSNFIDNNLIMKLMWLRELT
jgi:hypothetical protein